MTRPPEWLEPSNWVFVSRSHAEANHSRRFVYNGVDPEELIYSESKDDYFLFAVHDLNRAMEKGFGIVVRLKQECGFPLIVAGGGNREAQEGMRRKCVEIGGEFVGWMDGKRKAELFAGAKALLFPTQVPEPFGLVAVEAMMSGTPVIASGHGAGRELVSDEVGFVCLRESEYLRAVGNVGQISSRACRKRAMSRFHYRVMASGYVSEYVKEISAFQVTS
jgi:glycosyltransferase involved in cell wall biosynthesis